MAMISKFWLLPEDEFKRATRRIIEKRTLKLRHPRYDVEKLIRSGYTTEQIAIRLGISPSLVKRFRRQIERTEQ